ncbi:hypothetical protein BP5796_07675 [Coleophoma crateriformis]|uniref:SET domain-containing protein n=1 Tax=Coleophoma crateriformis TaxID=565419 RepID=A0A3D8RJK5_9HELO|nr:hypothetical protein BP5796_07675 [Coleophoma crateriformis]
MRSLPFLSLYVVAVVAHASGHGHNEVCASNSLFFQHSSGGPEYAADLQFPPSRDTADEEILQQLASDAISCRNHTLCDAPRAQNWTSSLPCIKGIFSDEEICVFTDSNFAQGRGISLLTTPARAQFIASQPAFTNSALIKDVNPDLAQTVPTNYKMKEIPGKGMGLEAIRHMKQGQLIMANTPSLMIDYRSFEWLPVQDHQLLQTMAVEYLPEAHQAAIMQLSTHDDVTDMPKDKIISKITSTNSFDIIPHREDPEQDYKLFTLFPDIARLNHDCRPNAAYRFDHETMTQKIHAIRDILPGEELTLSYTNPSVSRQERQDRLKRLWGFQCGCNSCTQDESQGKESDDRVAQINLLKPKFTDYPSTATAAMAELLINLSRQEGLWETIYLPYTYAALKYNSIGESSMAVKYAPI